MLQRCFGTWSNPYELCGELCKVSGGHKNYGAVM